MMYVRSSNGTLVPGKPEDIQWYLNYVVAPIEMLNKRHRMKFRKRFRMSIETYHELLKEVKEHHIFDTWKEGNTDCAEKKVSPIELLVLGVLRYLGRDANYDDLEEMTYISERTHARFFDKFIEYGSTILYQKYVVQPVSHQEAMDHMHEMILAGLPGALGSTDGSHILFVQRIYSLRHIHLGYKLSKTARAYNMTVNHRKRILSTTSGHPSTWNDKTIVLYDDFITGINNGDILSDFVFELLERDDNNEVKKRQYTGVWILADNGYSDWSSLIAPSKYSSSKKK
jgi:hypothetical protein